MSIKERLKEMEGFIEKLKEIGFADIEELYERRDIIREKYRELDRNERTMYKYYYFYQLCCLDYDFKSIMWDYICRISETDAQVNHQYKIFKNKKEKYHQKYLLEEQKKKDL